MFFKKVLAKMELSFLILFFSIFLYSTESAAEVKSDVHDISSIPGLKLILNDTDVPEKYRKYLFFDENGRQHLRGNDEIIYRVFVSNPKELKFTIQYFRDHKKKQECYLDSVSRFAYIDSINKKLFRIILQNNDVPIDMTQAGWGTKFSKYKYTHTRIHTHDFIFLETFDVIWKDETFHYSDHIASDDKFHQLPSFSNVNGTKIYYFDLFYNEFGKLKCDFEVILPSDYLTAIIIYDQTLPIFEEYSSYFLAGFIAFIVILILLCFGILVGGIYLGYLTIYHIIMKKSTSESPQPESSHSYNEYEAEKVQSKSDSNEMEDDLLECDCIECMEDQKNKEKLIRSMIPDIRKVVNNCICDGIDQKYLVPESQAAFTKLIKQEMKRRNLKPKKNEIEEVVKKLVTKENVESALEERKASTNLVLKSDESSKI